MNDEMDKNSLLYVLQEEKEMNLKGGIYHQTQIRFAYNSNHIEGSQLTEEQTRYIYETNTIGISDEPANVDDIIETVNHFRCFDYLLDCAKKPLTEEIIKHFHYILKSNTSDSRKEWFKAGDYKKLPNFVGGKHTTPPEKVEKEIQQQISEYLAKENIKFEDIIEFHYRFEKTHPFQDGNGRVGRLIMFKECLKHDIVPFVVDDTHKMFYYRGLKEYEEEKGYLTDTCLSAQDKYKEWLDYFRINYRGKVQEKS